MDGFSSHARFFSSDASALEFFDVEGIWVFRFFDELLQVVELGGCEVTFTSLPDCWGYQSSALEGRKAGHGGRFFFGVFSRLACSGMGVVQQMVPYTPCALNSLPLVAVKAPD